MKKSTVFSFAVLMAVLIAAICLFAFSFLSGQLNPGNLFIEADSFSKNPVSGEVAGAGAECFQAKEHIVIGNSLSGIVENGETVNIFLGYYACNEIGAGEVVAYDYAGNENLIIKLVKALPGDSFSLKESKESVGWNLFVNGEILANSENRPYLFNERRHRMLSLYERDYKGIVPENSYLLLGNVASGSVDSTVFGLVHKSDIVGKVEW